MTRLCTHPEHAQFGLGHEKGPRLVGGDYEARPEFGAVAIPADYIAPDAAPVLDQGSYEWCELYTAETIRWLTQPPIYSDTFDIPDLAKLLGMTPNEGTYTAKVEAKLLSPGMLCDKGPGAGQRLPVKSCLNVSTIAGAQQAILETKAAALAIDWYESYFSPPASGILPAPAQGKAGGHIFRRKGWKTSTGRPMWFCQNSWNTSWGLGGFFWLPMDYPGCGDNSEGYTQIAMAATPIFTPTKADVRTFTLKTSVRFIAADGSLVQVFKGTTIAAGTLAGAHPGPAHSFLAADGTTLYVLDRNATFS